MKTIHIAGTNGKGSTATYLASILSRRHKTGLYTSPHIRFFQERFVLDGRRIEPEALDDLLARERDEGAHQFAVWTKAAKRWLEEAGAEYAVVETGLGGAQDPTLMFDSDFEIITPIALDHTEILGNTISRIASEKAGIIRPGSEVLTARQAPEAMAVLERTAAERGASLRALRPGDVEREGASLEGQTFSIRRPDLTLENLSIRALSPSQTENAALAALAARKLGARDEDIREGLRRARVEGRVEYVAPDVLIDGGHNEQALEELRRTLELYFPERGITVLFAMMKEKDAAAAARILESVSDDIWLTRADEKRGFPPSKLASFFSGRTREEEDPMRAFDEAWKSAREKGNLLLVCGSFYLLGDVAERVEEAVQHRLASAPW